MAEKGPRSSSQYPSAWAMISSAFPISLRIRWNFKFPWYECREKNTDWDDVEVADEQLLP